MAATVPATGRLRQKPWRSCRSRCRASSPRTGTTPSPRRHTPAPARWPGTRLQQQPVAPGGKERQHQEQRSMHRVLAVITAPRQTAEWRKGKTNARGTTCGPFNGTWRRAAVFGDLGFMVADGQQHLLWCNRGRRASPWYSRMGSTIESTGQGTPAEAAENALWSGRCRNAKCAAGAVVALFRLDGDRHGRADRLAQFAGDAAPSPLG